MRKNGVGHVRQDWLKEMLSHLQIMAWWEMLCKKNGLILFAQSPIKVGLLLSNSAFSLMVLHVKHLRLFHMDLGFEDVVGCEFAGVN